MVGNLDREATIEETDSVKYEYIRNCCNAVHIILILANLEGAEGYCKHHYPHMFIISLLY